MPRLKVLHPITHLAVGGASENTLTTCRYVDPTRFESAILCGRPGSKEENLLKLAQSFNVPLHYVPSLQRSIHPGADMRSYREMVTWLKRNRWDIVHTHTSKAGILGRLAAKKVGVRVIIHTAHGWGHHNHMNPLKKRLFITLERAAARASHAIIAVSQSTLERGLRDGIGGPEQYHIIHSGIDISRYRDVEVDTAALRESLGIPVHAPVVGTVSRLMQQKAPEDFLNVAKMVHRRCPEVRFVFVGGGPGQEEFEAGIREKRLEGVVLNVGYRLDIPQILRLFDVFLLTSLWEGLPRVFAQAMCARLPIVATRVDGTPEAVTEGETGFLADPRDWDTMGAAVLRLLGDGPLRRKMGTLGLERVYPAFCDRDMVLRIEKVYESCLSRQAK